MPAIEWRAGVILQAQLNSLRDLVSGDFAYDVQPEVDARRYAAGRDNVPILDHTRLLVCGADERQQLCERPMGRSASSFEKARNS
jgi:hypothetical protein